MQAGGQLLLARCGTCRGSWVGEPWVVYLFTAPERDLRRLAAADGADPAFAAPRSPPACVRCSAPMARQSTPSGIMVSVCPRHGIWFDAGELGIFLRYVTSL